MANEVGNNITDGYEKLNGGTLPVGVKARLGADPLVADTDGDGLTDEFELLKMGLFTEVTIADTDGDGISDPDEDFDSDNLTNIREQSFGTNPLLDDTDGDDLPDGAEIIAGSDPLRPDTDYDGLDDDSEVRLGTNITVPDSNGNGIPDGNETYNSPALNESLGIELLVNGSGDIGKKVIINNFTSPAFLNNSAVVSNIIDLSLNETINNATLTMRYDPIKVTNPANLKLASFNDTIGTYDFIPSVIDTVAQTVTGQISQPSLCTIIDTQEWEQIYEPYKDLNRLPFNASDYWWVSLEGYQLQSLNPQYFNNSYSFPPGYYRIQCYGAYNNVVLAPWIPWSYGAIAAWNDYDNDYGMAVRYYKNGQINNTPVRRLLWGTDTLEIEHHGGQIGMWNNDVGDLSNNDGSVQYRLSYAAPLNETDTDGDGLYDRIEKFGFPDGLGRIHYTDYLDPDTDGDCVSDGWEAGEFTVKGWQRYYHIRCDPEKPDTDDDELDDYDEIEVKTSLFNPDTDYDFIKDGLDEEPLINNQLLWFYNTASNRIVGEVSLRLGFVFGDTGLEGGVFHSIVGDTFSEHPSYLGGMCASGTLDLGNIRDAASAYLRGDPLGIALNVIGTKIFNKGLSEGAKYLQLNADKLNDVSRFFCKEKILDGLTVEEELSILDELHKGYASVLYNKHNIPLANIKKLAENDVWFDSLDKLLDIRATGAWSSGPKGMKPNNLQIHFNEKRIGLQLGPDDIDEYVRRATELVNRRDDTVFLYWEKGKKLVVYEKATENVAVVGFSGEISSYYFKGKPLTDGKHVLIK